MSVAVGQSNGAEEGIRTPTLLRAPAPQAGASASSATSAWSCVRRDPFYFAGAVGAGVAGGGTTGAGFVVAGGGAAVPVTTDRLPPR